MSLKHLLVHVDSAPGTEVRLALAVELAKRFGARVTGLFAESGSIGTSIVGRRSPEHHRGAATAARERFASAVSPSGVDAEWWSLGYEAEADLIGLVVACCRYVDLPLLGQHTPERRLPLELNEQVVADCGRSVLIVPAEGRSPGIGRRIAVGWNASRGGARALNDALPFMKGAELVSVLSFQAERDGEAEPTMPRVSIVEHLALHGVKPMYERALPGPSAVGVAEALLNHAFERSADLVVAGVHEPGKLRRGGFTVRDLLASMSAPSLLAQ